MISPGLLSAVRYIVGRRVTPRRHEPQSTTMQFQTKVTTIQDGVAQRSVSGLRRPDRRGALAMSLRP